MSNNRIFGGTGLDEQAATNILIHIIGSIKEHHIKIDGKHISNHKMIEWLTRTVTEEVAKKKPSQLRGLSSFALIVFTSRYLP